MNVKETFFPLLAALAQKYLGSTDFFSFCSRHMMFFSVGEIWQIFRVFSLIFQDSCHHALLGFWGTFLHTLSEVVRTLSKALKLMSTRVGCQMLHLYALTARANLLPFIDY